MRSKFAIFQIQEPGDPNLTKCGIGNWRPGWLQVFANPIAFLINLCLVNMFQLMSASIFYGTMSTLERRFSYNSQISAMIMVSDLIFSAILSPIVGYYAIRFHRTRLIAMGSISLGFACLVTTLPFFIYGAASHNLSSNVDSKESLLSTLNSTPNAHLYEFCPSESPDCSLPASTHNTIWPAVFLLGLGNFLRGIGFTTYYTLAMPFIDDSVPKSKSPFFISIMHGVNLIGRIFGYFFVAFCLRYRENPWSDSGLSQSDPRYIGAWWLGFFITGLLVIVSSLPLFLFPQEFKTSNIKTKEIKESLQKSEASFKQSILRFFMNPLIMLYFFGNEFRYIGINGFYAFMAKYFESQYRTTSSQASLIAGSTGFAPVSIGLIIGGAFVSYYKPKARLLFTFIFFAELVSVFTIGSGLFLGCDSIKLAGAEGEVTNGNFSLSLGCNGGCDCTTRAYSPACGPDGKTTYFSPCHGGCSVFNEANSTFTNCSCTSGFLTSGYCPSDQTCSNLPAYLIILTIGTLISASARPGNSLITFRSVDPIDKSFTNGILSALLSILAFIPCELSFGHIVDSACLVWESKCGKRGNCWIYDQEHFKLVYLGVATVFMAVGSLFDFIIIFYADGMKSMYGEEEEDKDNQRMGKKIENN